MTPTSSLLSAAAPAASLSDNAAKAAELVGAAAWYDTHPARTKVQGVLPDGRAAVVAERIISTLAHMAITAPTTHGSPGSLCPGGLGPRAEKWRAGSNPASALSNSSRIPSSSAGANLPLQRLGVSRKPVPARTATTQQLACDYADGQGGAAPLIWGMTCKNSGGDRA